MGDKRKMTKEELKNKCKERAKIFQQAMECCHSSSPIDCIEWFADRIADLEKENAVLEKRIERAKECMKKLLFIINSDPANYNCKGLVQDAEDFIHNQTCNIRQQGQHCISETRCIMCDK